MTSLNLLGNLELIEVRVVVALDFGLTGLRLAARKAGVVEGNERNLAGLGNCIRVVGCVLLEEGLKVGVRRVDGLLDVLAGDDCVGELHLLALLEVVRADGVVRDSHAAGDECFETLKLEVLFDLLLEVRDAYAEELLDEVHVLLVADELATRKEILRERAGAELAAEIVIGDL